MAAFYILSWRNIAFSLIDRIVSAMA